MNLKGIFLCWIAWTSLGATSPQHSFYVSITEIRHEATEGILQVRVKAFTNDLETALHHNGAPASFKLDKGTAAQPYLVSYLLKSLKVKLNGKPLSLTFTHIQQETDATWSYLEAEDVCEIERLSVYNALLLDVIDGQTNIVRLLLNGKEYNYNLDKWVREEEFVIKK